MFANAPRVETSRIIAGLYNIIIWASGLLVFIAGTRASRRYWLVKLPRAAFWIFAIMAGLAILTIMLWYGAGVRNLVIQTPIGAALSGTANHLVGSSNLGLIEVDWRFGAAAPRTRMLGPYPTSTTATFLLFLPFFLMYLAKIKPNARFLLIFILCSASLAFYFAFSRTAFLGAVLSAGIALGLMHRGNLMVAVFGTLLVIPFLVVELPTLVDNFLSIRQGSSDQRLGLYQYQITQVLERAPWIGLGVKERVDAFNVPLGSHSTYFGALYKTGFLGLMVLTIFLMTVTARAITSSIIRRGQIGLNAALLFAIVSVQIWMVAEDIDAPQFVSFVFFFLAGLVFTRPDETLNPFYSAYASNEVETAL